MEVRQLDLDHNSHFMIYALEVINFAAALWADYINLLIMQRLFFEIVEM